MNPNPIIKELAKNKKVFKELLSGLEEKVYLWKSAPEKWCLLEIICHLHDEEREDFRARTKHVLESPTEPMPPIDPQGWVEDRAYLNQDYNDKLNAFLKEREASVEWLRSLRSPKWDNAYEHPKFGAMTAKMFLSNWIAHDYLHICQIIRVKFDYLKQLSKEDLTYAGNW